MNQKYGTKGNVEQYFNDKRREIEKVGKFVEIKAEIQNDFGVFGFKRKYLRVFERFGLNSDGFCSKFKFTNHFLLY